MVIRLVKAEKLYKLLTTLKIMKISDIPWYDRPGARISRDEIKELSDADLLSVIIGKGRKESVLELSNRLLNKYNLNKLEDLGLEGILF